MQLTDVATTYDASLWLRSSSWMAGLRTRVLIPAADTGGMVALIEQTASYGAASPRHLHRNEDEILHVLDGELIVWLDGTTTQASSGMTLLLRRNCEHALVVASARMTLLTLYTPGGFERMFLELATGTPSRWPSSLRGTHVVEQMIATAARYNCEITGPALNIPTDQARCHRKKGLYDT